VKYRKTTAILKNSKGETIFSREIEVPEGWSENAALVMAQKYARPEETSARDVFQRLVRTWESWFPVPDPTFAEDMMAILEEQRGAPNSPQFFNTGVRPNPQASACFIQPVEDSLEGIMALLTKEVRLFKQGSGSGTNFSTIRHEGAPLSGGGTASGVMSFLRIGDAAAGAIKSGGTTRRAAKMVSLEASHPDVEKFVDWKAREEMKVAYLVAGSRLVDALLRRLASGEDFQVVAQDALRQGVPAEALKRPAYHRVLDTDWQGEAYATVSGQNSNNSVALTDEDMETRPALIRQIARAAWASADPGVHFLSAMNAHNPVPHIGQVRGSNPCSEHVFLDNTACNLASINLVKFYDDATGIFAYDALVRDVRRWVQVLDATVTHAGYPTEEVAERSRALRPIGLGFANLGGLLMRMGLPYDSAEGREMAGWVMKVIHNEAVEESIRLAAALGHFEGLDRVRMARVLATQGVTDDALARLAQYGIRNAMLTNIAPTGTIGMLMDCDTTGIEPDYAIRKWKSLSGGGGVMIVSEAAQVALRKLGVTRIEDVPANKRAIFHCAQEISPAGHLRMMIAVQRHVSGAISKTVNLPNSATVDDVEQVIYEAWRTGLKAVAIYRDGSKFSQPLVAAAAPVAAPVAPAVAPPAERVKRAVAERVKLPARRRGYTHRVLVDKVPAFVRTGEYEDGSLGEVFIDAHTGDASFERLLEAVSILVSVALQHGVPLTALAKGLRGLDFAPRGVVTDHPDIKWANSILDVAFRDLELTYAPAQALPSPPVPVISLPVNYDHTGYTEKACPECGNRTLVRNGTCEKCVTCGTTTGCS